MISVILVEPEHPGNVGAVARVMMNFEFEQLILINPQCDYKSEECENRAKHAQSILDKAIITNRRIFDNFDMLIATTSVLGTDYNVSRLPLNAEQLSKKIQKQSDRTKIGIVFGSEGKGLSNADIRRCDFVVSLPTSRSYHSLNLSHSVAIVLYEIRKQLPIDHITTHIKPAGPPDKKQLYKMIDQLLDDLEFDLESRRETQKKVWRRVIGKAMLTRREAFALMGFFRKLVK
ncbi:RNA methyltransferase [Candidatus Woesearchaeota archaeon]|nr:RNA methyltransferase [Candidatus Woesearchaeota archaeon]